MIIMFGESSEHTTQETYLGYNMVDAIQCHQSGRWPTGLERLEDILGRQGNLLTVDDMFFLHDNHPSLYRIVKTMCHAVRTCQPNPEHEHGGCTRAYRPGCQSWNPVHSGLQSPYFARGAGYHGACSKCPINSEAGLEKAKNRTKFREAVLQLGIHRAKLISTTDVLLLKHEHPVGSTPKISIMDGGHSLKFNKPSVLDEDDIKGIFTELAVNHENRIDIGPEGRVIVHEPFIAPTSRNKDWQKVHSVEYGDSEWDISLTNFSNTRIRYFVGAVDPSKARHKFVERIPRGVSHQHSVRLKVEDSLLVWLPSPAGSVADSGSWKERLGENSAKNYEEMNKIQSLTK